MSRSWVDSFASRLAIGTLPRARRTLLDDVMPRPAASRPIFHSRPTFSSRWQGAIQLAVPEAEVTTFPNSGPPATPSWLPVTCGGLVLTLREIRPALGLQKGTRPRCHYYSWCLVDSRRILRPRDLSYRRLFEAR